MSKSSSKRRIIIKKRAKELISLVGLTAVSFGLIDKLESNDDIALQSDIIRRNLRATSSHHGATTTNSDKAIDVYIPPDLDPQSQRRLSLNLGNGNCQWQPPVYEVPNELDFHKTIITGFPSGDKRMIFTQMEALTGWPAKDEWDFKFMGMTNHPFIKANYPHHEGTWGWQEEADQVIMMIRNIRKSMVEYHDILWDLGVIFHYNITDTHRNKFPPHTNPFANTTEAWDEVENHDTLADLYSDRPPIEDFLDWRDLRVLEECSWYGWFIDYWMEGGLLRDIYTHRITTTEHWNMLMMPFAYTHDELEYDLVVGNQTVTPSYDPHCINYEVTGGCEPVAIISAEKLRDYTEGPPETTKIANVLLNDERTGQYVIAQEAWDCIWEELIKNGKGLKTINDKPGFNPDDYNFSAEMLQAMIDELTRLIDKYSGPQWNEKKTANRVVELITEHRTLIEEELVEVNSGVRTLTDKDFLGPKERALRKKIQAVDDTPTSTSEKEKDYSRYFLELDQMRWQNKQREMKATAQERLKQQEKAAEAAQMKQTTENRLRKQAESAEEQMLKELEWISKSKR